MDIADYFFTIWGAVVLGLLLLFLIKPKVTSYFIPGRRRTRREQEADDKRLRTFYKTEEQTIWNHLNPTAHMILGVPVNASRKEIETAFKKRIKQYHPDKVQHLGPEYVKVAQERTIQITKARDELLTKINK